MWKEDERTSNKPMCLSHRGALIKVDKLLLTGETTGDVFSKLPKETQHPYCTDIFQASGEYVSV